jgi:hypothetical protein
MAEMIVAYDSETGEVLGRASAELIENASHRNACAYRDNDGVYQWLASSLAAFYAKSYCEVRTVRTGVYA